MSLSGNCFSVSTHSRPKAAAGVAFDTVKSWSCFNTQPPEGGCQKARWSMSKMPMFQHTAARRRLHFTDPTQNKDDVVSTHSRPKAAAFVCCFAMIAVKKFQHTAARRRLRTGLDYNPDLKNVSTHSRPKAAANVIPS